MKTFALLIAEFFYLGRIPFAPGTFGSLGALSIWIPSVYFNWPFCIKIVLLFLIFILGLWASKYGIEYYQKEDPKQVVIDEVVGQGIPFLIIEPSLFYIIISFLLFRFFDILKPWPIKSFEKKYKNAFGLMFDDVLAGIFALVCVFTLKHYY